VKGLLLAAGLGTRLRPLTDSIPKCLVPIGGRPLLGWWLELLEREQVTDLRINLHHFPEQVEQFLSEYRGPISVETVWEPELLGSAGTIVANREFIEHGDPFFILYGDNLTNVRLRDLLEHNRRHPAILTVGLFHAENPSACGIAELENGREGLISRFVEKPSHPKSDLASAGMFVARPELLRELHPDATPPYDFGGRVMPSLEGRMNGIVLDGYIRDIGTHRSLQLSIEEWPGISEE
jgi:mannose-1-phosphate guanylyltransferase